VDAWAAMRNANYRLFASGFLSSGIGLQVLSTVIGWELYERTGNVMAIGYAGFFRAAPVVLLTLVSGQVADTFNRRNILVYSQIGFALAAFGLAASAYFAAPIWVTYALLVMTGLSRAFNGSARNALLPQIVPADVFQNAVTWNSGLFQTAAIAGPVLGGTLIAISGGAWLAYLVTAAGCGMCAALGAGIEVNAPTPSGNAKKLTVSGMFDGATHVWREKTVLGALTLDLMAVLVGGVTGLLPVYAKDILHVGPTGLGVLRASTYVGALLMAVWLAHRPPFTRAGAALLWSVAAFGVATVAFGLSENFFLSVACLSIAGAVDNISVVIRHVLVQVRTPEGLRGRVSAVNSVFIECSNEIGAYESALVANWFGPVASAVSGGVGTIAVVGFISLVFPALRRLRKLDEK
jgi:MFS family permease